MSILSDADLGHLREAGKLSIQPFNDERLTPIGYNLSVGDLYISKKSLQRVQLSPGESFHVPAGETVAIRTLEYIELPHDKSISGLLASKIKMINAGFGHISTTIDSDHRGRLIVSVQNLSSNPATLVQGQPFCTIVLLENKTPSKMNSNNFYDEHEIIENLINAWRSQHPDRILKLWRLTKPFVPIAFVLIAGISAYGFFGKTPAFGGVVAAIAVIGVLLDRIINAR